MGNEAWIAIRRAVQAGLDDDGSMLENPPRTEEEVGYLADGITDYVVGAIDEASRRALTLAEQDRDKRSSQAGPRKWPWRRPTSPPERN